MYTADAMPDRSLTSEQKAETIELLKARFENNMHRHDGLAWEAVQARLEADSRKLWSLSEMERTGGEPDVIVHENLAGEAGDAFLFCDCSKQSPAGRRSICYDGEARRARKKHPPSDSALEMAAEMGIEILTEEAYRALQKFGPFDTTTSSWVETPPDIRERGGALFGDFRYGHVFIYHNGADSYYAARGFRGMIRV